MNKAYNIICAFISIIMYFLAPEKYDVIFCALCLILFAVVAIPIVINDSKKINVINFNVLFLFSFFFCSYVFPVFLIGTNSILENDIISYLTSFDTINRTTSLCTVAICFYALVYNKRKRLYQLDILAIPIPRLNRLYHGSHLIVTTFCITGLYVLYNFIGSSHNVEIEVEEMPYLFQTLYIILPMFLVCAVHFIHKREGVIKLKRFILENKFVIFLLVLLMLLFLIIGDRAPVITIAFSILATIALLVKNFNYGQFAVLIFTGIILMFTVRETRLSSASLRKGNLSAYYNTSSSALSTAGSAWEYFSDLVGVSMELNAGMEYCDNYGHPNVAASIVNIITVPFPFLPSLTLDYFFGLQPKDISPGNIIAQYTKTHSGSHCVIDVYMSFGVIGVIIIFSILGWFVAFVTNRLNNKIFYQIVYIYLIATAIFLARNSVINIYRAIATLFILFIICNSKLFRAK